MPDIDREGIARARTVAAWELGDPQWANVIVRAYLEPDNFNYLEASRGMRGETSDSSGALPGTSPPSHRR